ncbi:MAG: transketolase [Candidatus Chisholmbacteria bacterium]|nr:transketolase [Candidatus Chisholmbacteria bacterium]
MNIRELQDKANLIREDIIKMLVAAGSGHSAGPLGMADIFTALYFGGVLEYRADEPWWRERDRLVLSAGHIVPVLYPVLAHAGFFPIEEIYTLRKINSRLQGHPHAKSVPGIENTSGPLGQGTSVAVGMALALKMDFKAGRLPRLPRVICVDSDGEMQEGQTWESFMFAAKNHLDNLTYVIDRNHIQIDGYTEEIMPLEPLVEKLESFGLQVFEVDGHNMQAILDAFNHDASVHRKPVAIVANTTPGKGVKYMENKYEWHGKPPSEPGEAVEALTDIHALRTLGGKIVSEHE